MWYRMKSLVIVSVCVCMGGLFLGTSAVNADMVNGSFESPALAENGYQSGVADNWITWAFTGWVINGNNASGDGMYAPSHGNQFQEYNGWVGQNTDIPLVSGNTYNVSFDVNPGTFSGLSTIVNLNAVPDTNPASEGPTFAAQTYSGFTASDWTAKEMSAAYTGDPGKYLSVWIKMDSTSIYGGLDNVVVTVSPEPSVVMLMATGVLGLLAYAWRKRR
jgi:hypothetical protein